MSEGIELTAAQLRKWAGLGRRWGQGRNPEAVAARLEKWVDAVGSATLTLLAGFSTTAVIVVSDDTLNFRWPGFTVLALTVASVLLIGAVQFAYHARVEFSISSERKDSSAPPLDGNSGDTDTQDAKSQKDRHHLTGLTWTSRAHFVYHWGLFFLLAGLGLAVAPHHAMGTQGTFQWSATVLAWAAGVAELVWIGWWRWWSWPWQSQQLQRWRAAHSQRDALADRERTRQLPSHGVAAGTPPLQAEGSRHIAVRATRPDR
jgi:hypothetical protein